jgi:hypothetical protein
MTNMRDSADATSPRQCLDLLTDRLLQTPVTTGGNAGEHPLQHDPRSL